MSQDKYSVGLDFGIDSVRAVIVNAVNGFEEATPQYLTIKDGVRGNTQMLPKTNSGIPPLTILNLCRKS